MKVSTKRLNISCGILCNDKSAFQRVR